MHWYPQHMWTCSLLQRLTLYWRIILFYMHTTSKITKNISSGTYVRFHFSNVYYYVKVISATTTVEVAVPSTATTTTVEDYKSSIFIVIFLLQMLMLLLLLLLLLLLFILMMFNNEHIQWHQHLKGNRWSFTQLGFGDDCFLPTFVYLCM